MKQKQLLLKIIIATGCFIHVFLLGHGFIADTLISTPSGTIPIAQLKEGDLVISRDDPSTKKI